MVLNYQRSKGAVEQRNLGPVFQIVTEPLEKLTSNDIEQQKAAAGELRLQAKRNADNRVCIAEAEAIPLLIEGFIEGLIFCHCLALNIVGKSLFRLMLTIQKTINTVNY